MKLALTIDTASMTAIFGSFTIAQGMNGRNSSASFDMKNIDLDLMLPALAPVVISDADLGTPVFSGFITGTTATQESADLQVVTVNCTGLEYLLSNITVNLSWTGASDQQIIEDAFLALPSISTSGVNQLGIIPQFDAKDISLLALLNNLIAITGGEYRVTAAGVLSYRRTASVVAPFGFSND